MKKTNIYIFCIILLFIGCNVGYKAKNDCHYSDVKIQNISDYVSLDADTFYEEGFDTPLITNVKLFYEDSLIFYDSISFYETSLQNLSYKDTIAYILLRMFDPISAKNLVVLRYVENKDVSAMKIEGQLIKDIDNDGIVEIVGKEYSKAICLQCDSNYYVPIIVHKLEEECSFNEELTKKITSLKYGTYLGNKSLDTILISKTINFHGILF